MVDIRVKDLPLGTPSASKLLAMDLTTTERASIRDVVYAGRPSASQAEAEAGTDAEKVMTSVATKQSIASEVGVTLASYAQGLAASTALQPPAIGSSIQAFDAGLQSISGLATSANQFLYTTGSDAYATSPLTAFGRSVLDDPDAATARVTLELENVNNTSDANKPVSTAQAAADNLRLLKTANLSDIADAATARTSLGLGTAATADATDFAQLATFAADTGSSLVTYKRNTANQSGGGTTTTIARPVFEVLSERVSLYDYIPRNVQADFRAGTYSGDSAPFFAAAAAQNKPSNANVPGGAEIIIPAGEYPIGTSGAPASIPLVSSVVWRGETKNGTRIIGMGNAPVFKSIGVSGAGGSVGRAGVRDVTIIGAGKSNLYGYGVELLWMNNPFLYNVQFQNLRWCIVQEYVVNAFIQECTSNGSSGTIRGYLWKKAIDSTSFAGFDNTTTMSDVYFMAGDLAMVLHGSNGIQMGGNVAMLQGGIRVGAIAETLPDGTPFTPGATSDVIHFQHWDGLRLDTITNDRGIHIVKGAMAAPHDFRLSSLWCGNVTGTNSYVCNFDGLEDFSITCANIDVTGLAPFWFQNCKRGSVTGVAVRSFGGSNSQNAVLIQSCESIGIVNNSFNVHASATVANGVRAESSSRIRVCNNDFDFRAITPTGSVARRSVLIDSTSCVVGGNTANNTASVPAVETGTSNFNRIHDNPSSVAPTIVGANTLAHHNNTSTT